MTDYVKALVITLVSLATFFSPSYRHLLKASRIRVWFTVRCTYLPYNCVFILRHTNIQYCARVPDDVHNQHPGHLRDASKSSLRRRLGGEDHLVIGRH